MYRGTTPTVQLTVTGVDLSVVTRLIVTFKQFKTEINKELKDVFIDGDVVQVPLTQEETLSLSASAPVYVQIRGKVGDDVFASDTAITNVEDILHQGEI